ncbi:MAG: hypothetical protein IT344_06465 [Candidatus Dadabacteria bacterium]|nr:hypothetical protein [Candidatus Dadabacteria bacterium]
METDDLEKLLIESKFERLVSKSQNYIDSRNESDLVSLRNDLIHLKLRLEHELEKSKKHKNPEGVAVLKLMLSIIQKFNYSVQLMENMKSKKPVCREFDTKQMLDILLPHLIALIEYGKSGMPDTKKLEEDCLLIESIEDQHKRVLLTYLVQDWHNMDEVINLLRIGEIYKNVAEKLVNLSLVTKAKETRQ